MTRTMTNTTTRPTAAAGALKMKLTLMLMLALTTVVMISTPAPAAGQAKQIRIVQTNAAGDNIHLIDPDTNEIVAEITGVEVVHGVAAAPDGSRLYLSSESTETLDIVDTKTLKVTNSIPLSGHPNNVAIHENGKKVYVAIQGTGGGVDIIDTEAEEHVRFIPICRRQTLTVPDAGRTGVRGVHNTFITPDSKHVVAGSTGGGGATITSSARSTMSPIRRISIRW